ncbi:helix-turn-helix domain-containing protein [Candidatus Poriferisodalis sp.]|uniref:helix-turn-helix domain-containing protein n=1 Tax=Candidatus Poriferisodalis sp. TaxID=3101277 RepID=UPI003B51C7C5
MSRANARLTPAGRLLLVERIEAGTTQAEVARQMGLSRGTVARWWHRYLAGGEAELVDRSSRPHRSPRRTPAALEKRVCGLRQSTKRGPAYLSARTGVGRARKSVLQRLCGPQRSSEVSAERETPGSWTASQQ